MIHVHAEVVLNTSNAAEEQNNLDRVGPHTKYEAFFRGVR